MALCDAVLAIAEAMERDGKAFKGSAPGAAITLQSFARELRTAVKASEGKRTTVKLLEDEEREDV